MLNRVDEAANGMLNRLSGKYYLQHSFSDVGTGTAEQIKDRCIRALVRSRIAYLSMQIGYCDPKGDNKFQDKMEEFDFIEIPFPNGNSIPISKLFRGIRNSLMHGNGKSASELKQETGYSSVQDLIFTRVRVIMDDRSRILTFLSDNTPDDPDVRYLGDMIVDEYMDLIEFYNDSTSTSHQPDYYRDHTRWLPLRLAGRDDGHSNMDPPLLRGPATSYQKAAPIAIHVYVLFNKGYGRMNLYMEAAQLAHAHKTHTSEGGNNSSLLRRTIADTGLPHFREQSCDLENERYKIHSQITNSNYLRHSGTY